MRLKLLSSGVAMAAAAMTSFTGIARATTYTDATGDVPSGQNPAIDIASAVLTNDASSISFKINLAPGANLSTFPYGYYEIGIQTAPNPPGSTPNGSNAVSNPYGNPIGISTGMTNFIAAQLGPNQGYVYAWQPSSSSFKIELNGGNTPVTVTNDTTSLLITVPVSYLGTQDVNFTPAGLASGASINFDIWSTFGGSGNSAYDALDNPNTGPGFGPAYDAATATGSTFASTTYTFVVPEPASTGVLGLAAMGLMRRRRPIRRT